MEQRASRIDTLRTALTDLNKSVGELVRDQKEAIDNSEMSVSAAAEST